MRLRMGAVLLMGLGLGMAAAQTQQPAQKDSMDGMDMGQGTSQQKSTGSGSGMTMGHCGCMGQGMGMKGMAMDHGKEMAPLAAGAMRVSFGEKSSDWAMATLAALPHKTVTVHNSHTKADETYSGVPLIDLLVRVDVPGKPHGKDLALYLVAEGSDGYKAVYSVAEVNPDVHDATVLVADREDGKPLAADGPLKLVASGETRPARWVRNLAAVRVMAAQ